MVVQLGPTEASQCLCQACSRVGNAVDGLSEVDCSGGNERSRRLEKLIKAEELQIWNIPYSILLKKDMLDWTTKPYAAFVYNVHTAYWDKIIMFN